MKRAMGIKTVMITGDNAACELPGASHSLIPISFVFGLSIGSR